jgi:hypothetical protein
MDFSFLLDDVPYAPKVTSGQCEQAKSDTIDFLKNPSAAPSGLSYPVVEAIDMGLSTSVDAMGQAPLLQAMSLNMGIGNLERKISQICGCGPWDEVKISNLLDYKRELAALEYQASALNGNMRRDFVRKHRARRQLLLDELSINPFIELLQSEFDKNLSIKVALMADLAQLELEKNRQTENQNEDENRAKKRLARYVSLGLL